MPRKNRRNRELDEAPPTAARPRSAAPEWAELAGFAVRRVTGDRTYRCPGCDLEIRTGVWHLVVVPDDDPDERRHWHTECWRRELRRLGSHR